MSELDGISPKDLAAFKRRVDSHAGIKAQSALENMHKGSYGGGNLTKFSPGDKNARAVKKHKKKYEKDGMERQREAVVEVLGHAFDLRKKEILNKNDFSIKDLLNTMAKFIPQQVDSKVETTHNFAEEIKRLTLEKKTYKAIDAEEVS